MPYLKAWYLMRVIILVEPVMHESIQIRVYKLGSTTGITTRHLIRILYESSPGLNKRANEEANKETDQGRQRGQRRGNHIHTQLQTL